jgi:hypothetical protein
LAASATNAKKVGLSSSKPRCGDVIQTGKSSDYSQIKQFAFTPLKESNSTFQIGQTVSAQFEVDTLKDIGPSAKPLEEAQSREPFLYKLKQLQKNFF